MNVFIVLSLEAFNISVSSLQLIYIKEWSGCFFDILKGPESQFQSTIFYFIPNNWPLKHNDRTSLVKVKAKAIEVKEQLNVLWLNAISAKRL